MITIKFYKKNELFLTAEANIGDNLMDICKKNNIKEIKGICGGNLCCASCHLLIKSIESMKLEKKSDEEEDMLYSLGEPYPLKNSRLSCQIILTEEHNNLEIEIV